MEQVEYITISGPLLPVEAAPISAEQKHYNPLQDIDVLEVDFVEMLDRAGLTKYTNIITVSHGIESAEEFSELQESDLELFCRVARDRVLLRRLLKNLKTLYNAPCDAEPAMIQQPEEPEQVDLKEIPTQNTNKFKNLYEYLSNRPEGKCIIAHYEAHKTLTNTLRNSMVKMILIDATAEGVELNTKFNAIMTEKITTLFPSENPETYYKSGYSTAEGRVGSSGKFVKRKGPVLLSLGMKRPKKAGPVKAERIETPVEDEQQLNARSWLFYGRAPVDMLRQKWDVCYELRRSDIEKANNLVEIFNLYPIFKDPKAAFLIEMDFEKMYPGATRNFYTWFPLLHQKLNKLVKHAVAKDKAYHPLFDDYEKTTDGRRKDYLLCLLLPIIIQTNYRVKGNWKPSIKETQDSFILEVQVKIEYSHPTVMDSTQIWIRVGLKQEYLIK